MCSIVLTFWAGCKKEFAASTLVDSAFPVTFEGINRDRAQLISTNEQNGDGPPNSTPKTLKTTCL